MGDEKFVRCWRFASMKHLCFVFTVLVMLVTGLSILAYVKHTNRVDDVPVASGASTSHTGAYGDLMWFMQLSDLHISSFVPQRGDDLQTFIQQSIQQIIRPQFVLATGDLTDGQHTKRLWKQDEPSWQQYARILNNTGVLSTPNYWLDVRGNHDVFHSPSYQSNQNMYSRYGASRARFGPDGAPYVYVNDWTSSTTSDTVRVVVMDQVSNFGLARTFNYLAHIRQQVMDGLASALQTPHRNGGKIKTFVAGHYPMSSAIISKTSGGKSMTQLSKDAGTAAYLCGHFHLEKMYHSRPDSNLELELAAWKDKRWYRIVAVDNGVFTFSDAKSNEWPRVHILNPKDNRYIVSSDNLASMRTSTHLRVLVWSDFPISSVVAYVDNVRVCDMDVASPGQPLYTCPWTAASYADGGDHTVDVVALDGQRREHTVSVTFNLDGQARPIGGGAANYFATINLPRFAFGIAATLFVVGVLFMLWIPKAYVLYLSAIGREEKSLKSFNYMVTEMLLVEDNGYYYADDMIRGGCGRLWLWQWRVHLWQYGHIATGYWLALNFWWLCLGVGPVLAGPISDDRWGVMFTWGVVDEHGEVFWQYEVAMASLAMCMLKLMPLTGLIARTVLAQHTTVAVTHHLRCKHRMFWTVDVVVTIVIYLVGLGAGWAVILANYPFINLLLSPAGLWIDVFFIYVFVRCLLDHRRGNLFPGQLAVSDVPPYGNYTELLNTSRDSEGQRRKRDKLFIHPNSSSSSGTSGSTENSSYLVTSSGFADTTGSASSPNSTAEGSSTTTSSSVASEPSSSRSSSS